MPAMDSTMVDLGLTIEDLGLLPHDLPGHLCTISSFQAKNPHSHHHLHCHLSYPSPPSTGPRSTSPLPTIDEPPALTELSPFAMPLASACARLPPSPPPTIFTSSRQLPAEEMYDVLPSCSSWASPRPDLLPPLSPDWAMDIDHTPKSVLFDDADEADFIFDGFVSMRQPKSHPQNKRRRHSKRHRSARSSSSPSSSSSMLSINTDTPELIASDPFEDDADSPFLQSPSAARTHELPSVDDDWIPSSPFRRSESPLPQSLELEPDFDNSDAVNVDYDLPSHHQTGSLLLLDDDVMALPSRPPSPDALAFESNSSLEPDVLQQLIALRKRCHSAERSARATEQSLLESGNAPAQRAEMRQWRKREKERCKEISALLRLKLDRPVRSPESTTGSTVLVLPAEMSAEEAVATMSVSSVIPNKSPRLPKASPTKTVISSMDQLVARMIFRRREASPTGRAGGFVPCPPSPLGPSRSSWASISPLGCDRGRERQRSWELASTPSPEDIPLDISHIPDSGEDSTAEWVSVGLGLGLGDDDDDDDGMPALRGFV